MVTTAFVSDTALLACAAESASAALTIVFAGGWRADTATPAGFGGASGSR